MSGADLAGRRVLLVEDEVLVAMLLEDVLRDAGCAVVGPVGRLSDAVAAARDEQIDAALLDVNLAGQKVFPAAAILAGRGVPFLLLTGYGGTALPPDAPPWPVCAKPFRPSELVERLSALMADGEAHAR